MFGKLLLTFLCIASTVTAFSQSQSGGNTWHLVVVDAADGRGIDKATIRIGKSIFISDNRGHAELNKELVSRTDTVKISCIGYNTLSWFFAGTCPDTLKLTLDPQLLKTVKVSASKTRDTGYTGGYLPTIDEEIAEYIPNIKHIKGMISSVEVKLLDDHSGLKTPFKINIYTKQKDGFNPVDTLIKDSVIIENPTGHHLVSVDVSRYQLQFPDGGIIVSFQTLPQAWYTAHKFAIVGKEYYLLPGIKGVWKNRDYKFDDKYHPNERYSLRRVSGEATWNKFEYGTNFNIGVTIDKEQ